MRFLLTKLLLLTALIIPSLIGCSSSVSDTVSPDKPTINHPYMQSGNSTSDTNRHLWGMWHLTFDPDDLQVIVEPARKGNAHFDVTEMLLPPECGDCFSVSVNSFDSVKRVLDIDVTLQNPASVDVYDVRGILFTDDAGHELRNPEGWTKLFDVPVGGSLNPFMMFARNIYLHKFEAHGSHTKNYLIHIPSPPQYDQITFAVTASYPGNCKEPFIIKNFEQDYLYEFPGYETELRIDVRDWQDDVDKVTLVAPEITGEEFTQFTYSSGDTWKMDILNVTGAPPGVYTGRIIATSANSGSVALYDFVRIYIYEWGGNLHPMDVFIPQLMLDPWRIEIDGDYACVSSSNSGLHFYDISNPLKPEWVNSLDTGQYTPGFTVKDGYAYASSDSDGLFVVDTDPPEQAHIVHVIDPDIDAYCIKTRGDYCYTLRGNLKTIDISSPENANIVSSMSIPGYGQELAFLNDSSAYIIDPEVGIHLVDLSNPLSANIVDSIETSTIPKFLHPHNGLVFCRAYMSYFYALDLEPFTQPSILGSCKLYGYNPVARDFVIVGDYAFVPNYSCLHILDISDPHAPYIARAVNIPGGGRYVAEKDGYAFVTNYYDGITVVDIDPPLESTVVGGSSTCNYIDDIQFVDDIAYVSSQAGLRIFDCHQIQDSEFIRGVALKNDINSPDRDLVLSDGYAYLISDDGFNIIDVEPYSTAHLVNTIEIDEDIDVFDASDGTACLINMGENTLTLMDVDPPETAGIVKDIPSFYGENIVVSDGYAYGGASNGLIIVDIDPITDAYIVNTLDTGITPRLIKIYNGQLLIVGYFFSDMSYKGRLQLFNISSPENPSEVCSYPFPYDTSDIEISDEYIFSKGSDITIYKNNLPDPLECVGYFEVSSNVRRIAWNDGYLLVTPGVDIYKLG